MNRPNMRPILKASIGRARDTCKLWLSHALPARPMPGGRELLDEEYAAGAWDYLRDADELPRFSVVAGYCHHVKPGGSVLEVGCGEGVLQERLCGDKYSRFLGVDISEQAIQRAAARQSENVGFVAADASTFQPPERVDVIVFNECLEYFAEPERLLRRYEAFLAEGGIYIVSMFVGIDNVRHQRIWKKIDAMYPAVAQARVSTGPRMTWTIKVFAPPLPES
ncbi:MAG: class I SAM-dependent methyltransferase [Thermoanaerobaculia bacterium]